MLRYSVKGQARGYANPITVAATNFLDIAEYIRDHAAPDVFDPDGNAGLAFKVVEYTEDNYFMREKHPRNNRVYGDVSEG